MREAIYRAIGAAGLVLMLPFILFWYLLPLVFSAWVFWKVGAWLGLAG